MATETRIILKRTIKTPNSTIGELYWNGQFECFTLEDPCREGPKVAGATAIPEGTYPVTIDYSPRFKKELPHVHEVSGFEGIRIHKGNSPLDTEGCILVGSDYGEDHITGSKLAFDRLFLKLHQAVQLGPVTITICTQV